MVEANGFASGNTSLDIYALPRFGSDLQGTSVSSSPIFSTSMPVNPGGARGPVVSYLSQQSGCFTLAYADAAGVLHVRLLQKDIDLPLEKGVSAIFPTDYYGLVGELH